MVSSMSTTLVGSLSSKMKSLQRMDSRNKHSQGDICAGGSLHEAIEQEVSDRNAQYPSIDQLPSGAFTVSSASL